MKPVRGPGQTGELVIHDGTTNRKRLYTPLSEPKVQPGDSIIMGPDGLPVAMHPTGNFEQFPINPGMLSFLLGVRPPGNASQYVGGLNQAGIPAAMSQKMAQNMAANSALSYQIGMLETQMMLRTAMPSPTVQGSLYNLRINQYLSIPVGQMELDAQRSAQVARMQLAGDVQAIESYNAPILKTNRQVRQVLSEAVGTDKGDDRSAWTKWMVDLFGFAYAPQKASTDETTIIEQVPLAYQPQAQFQAQPVGVMSILRHACFGAGTLVQTIDGPRPIEDLLAGDDVLTQNPRTGELKYQALVAVYHNPPNATFRIELEGGGESIVATGIHRLWKAGKGWAMVRDLKSGDVLRTLGGTAAVKSVEEERVQPVFNLRVADGESFFVGRSGILAHDNSTINPTPEPFDAVEALPEPGSRPAARRSVLGR